MWPRSSVTTSFPGRSLSGLWTVAKEVGTRRQKRIDFYGRCIEAIGLPLTEPLLSALHADITVSFNPHTLLRTWHRASLLHRGS